MNDPLFALTATDRRRLQELFARPKKSYAPPEAARLTHVPLAAIHARITSGEVEARGGRLAWDEVAALAFETWQPRLVVQALDPRASELLPALLQRTTLTITVPRWHMDLLAVTAHARTSRYAWTVNDVVERLLADTLELALTQPGIDEELQAAMRFPEGYRPTTLGPLHCTLCGTRLGTFPKSDTCHRCRAEHL